MKPRTILPILGKIFILAVVVGMLSMMGWVFTICDLAGTSLFIYLLAASFEDSWTPWRNTAGTSTEEGE